MDRFAKNFVRGVSLLPGRKRLYRASQFLIRTARGDVRNDIATNGEALIQSIALRAATSPAIFLDVGANVGNWTAGALRKSVEINVPVRIHAFEPCRDTYLRLFKQVGGFPDVTLVQQACSRIPGTAQMRVYGGGEATNSLAAPVDERRYDIEEVQVTTIDQYCEIVGLDKIDLLKIDAEGYDFEVIVGAAKTLDRKAVRFLQFEYNHRWIGARNFLKDVFSFLTPKGYSIGKISGRHVEFYPRWSWELETWDEGNYVACQHADQVLFPVAQADWLSFDS